MPQRIPASRSEMLSRRAAVVLVAVMGACAAAVLVMWPRPPARAGPRESETAPGGGPASAVRAVDLRAAGPGAEHAPYAGIAVDPGTDRASSSSGPASTSRDEEWEKLPRTEFTVHEFLRGTRGHGAQSEPAARAARRLYRNAHLNPRDVYIPPQAREALPLALEPLLRMLDLAQQHAGSVAAREFRAMLAAGRKPVLDLRDPEDLATKLTPEERSELASAQEAVRRVAQKVRGGASLDGGQPVEVVVPNVMFKTLEEGQRHVHAIRDGKVFMATVEEMPAARRAVAVEDALRREVVLAVLDWFTFQGCLTPRERESAAKDD